jgi:hypothetical protein
LEKTGRAFRPADLVVFESVRIFPETSQIIDVEKTYLRTGLAQIWHNFIVSNLAIWRKSAERNKLQDRETREAEGWESLRSFFVGRARCQALFDLESLGAVNLRAPLTFATLA